MINVNQKLVSFAYRVLASRTPMVPVGYAEEVGLGNYDPLLQRNTNFQQMSSDKTTSHRSHSTGIPLMSDADHGRDD